VRERATLQGFPITYQFYGNSHSQKVKMIGNAVPPLFAYLVGMAAQGLQGQGEFAWEHLPAPLVLPTELPDVTPPHAVGTDYPVRRRFRVAIPGLRFKSGMRFQLSNSFEGGIAAWTIEFFFGPSKQIRAVPLDRALYEQLLHSPFIEVAMRTCSTQLRPIQAIVDRYSTEKMQRAWRQSESVAGPYALVDQLGQVGIALTHALTSADRSEVEKVVLAACTDPAGEIASKDKLMQNASAILAGLALGSWFNSLRWAADEVSYPPAGMAITAG
jgi:DNA (cytosine-5)-methyltransferase 1